MWRVATQIQILVDAIDASSPPTYLELLCSTMASDAFSAFTPAHWSYVAEGANNVVFAYRGPGPTIWLMVRPGKKVGPGTRRGNKNTVLCHTDMFHRKKIFKSNLQGLGISAK